MTPWKEADRIRDIAAAPLQPLRMHRSPRPLIWPWVLVLVAGAMVLM